MSNPYCILYLETNCYERDSFEQLIRQDLLAHKGKDAFELILASTIEEAQQILAQRTIDLLLIDIFISDNIADSLNDTTGRDFLYHPLCHAINKIAIVSSDEEWKRLDERRQELRLLYIWDKDGGTMQTCIEKIRDQL